MNWNPATYIIAENVGGIREVIKARWMELRQNVLADETVIGSMEAEFAYLHEQGAYKRDKERWKDSPHTENLEHLTGYALERLHVLDAYILNEL